METERKLNGYGENWILKVRDVECGMDIERIG
jgi:hypothetical protein